MLNIPYMRRPENDTLIISVQQFKSLASGLVNVGEYSRRRIRGEYSPMITQPVVWKAITLLCGCLSLFGVFSSLLVLHLLHYVVWFIHYVS